MKWLVPLFFLGAIPCTLAESALAESETDTRPEVVLWHAYRAAEAEAIEAFTRRINDSEPDFRIKLLAVPYDAFLDKITAAIPRGKGPDLFIAAHDTIGDWAEAKTVSAIDDVMDPTLSSSLHDGLLDAVIYQGSVYGIPLAFKSVALWRNKKLAANAPETLGELLRVAEQNTGNGSYGLVYENRLLYFHAPFMLGLGGTLFDKNGQAQLATDANIASVSLAMDISRERKLVPQEVSGTLTSALFNDNKAAFIITGPWALGEIDEQKVDFAVSPLPRLDQKIGTFVPPINARMRPLLSVEAVMISGKTEKRDLAIRVAKRLADQETSELRLKLGLQAVARKSAWPSLEQAVAEAKNTEERSVAERRRDVLRAFLAQLPSTTPTPNTPAMKALWSPMDLALGQSLGQGVGPAESLADAQKKLDGVMAAVQARDADGGGQGQIPFFAAFTILGLLLALWCVSSVRRYGASRLVQDIGRSKTAYLYVAPAAVGMLVLVFVPFGLGVGMGFFKHTWGEYSFVGLRNYISILFGTDSRFFYTLGMTVLWTLSNVFLHVTIGVFLALLLSQAKLKARGLYRVLFIIPWAVPNYITALIWKGMFHPEFGAINQVLGLEGFSWMNQTWSAFLANLITNTWLGFPFMMVTAMGGLTAIPKELYEAAELDGAGPIRRLFEITLPLLRPTMAPAIVLGTVWTFNMFNIIYLVSGGAPGGNTDILITEAFRWAFERGQGGAFGYAASYSTLIFLMLLAYTTAANRVARAVSEENPS